MVGCRASAGVYSLRYEPPSVPEIHREVDAPEQELLQATPIFLFGDAPEVNTDAPAPGLHPTRGERRNHSVKTGEKSDKIAKRASHDCVQP